MLEFVHGQVKCKTAEGTTDYRLPKTVRSQALLTTAEDGRRNAIYIILDNVLDTYNIGSIFRLADAVAAKKFVY